MQLTDDVRAQLPEHLVLFDGECALCSRWARVVATRDRAGHWKLAASQSRFGKIVSEATGLEIGTTTLKSTMVVVTGGQVYARSSAVVQVLRTLGFPYRFFGQVIGIVPRPVRDFGYGLIARVRRVISPKNYCFVPPPGMRERFID